MSEFEKYKIKEIIGTGGMATIYLAENKDGKEVAIKEILPQISKDEEFIKRFVREIKIMQSLQHPNILPIYDASLGPEKYYIVMPYLSGGTLKDLSNIIQRIPLDFSIYILQQIAKALEYAHHKGIIHRDLKPSNVMFSGDGNLYLTDFGVARASTLTQLTQTGEILGTPAYMSPEQVLGMPIDYKSDYFSFGIICYEILTGTNPFMTDNPITTMKKIVEFYPPGPMDLNPSIPPSIENIILKLLKKEPKERPENGFEIIEEFLAYWKGKEAGNLKENFAKFLNNPEEEIKKYQKKEALEHKEKAKQLLFQKENKTMVYWHIYQAYQLNPEDLEAFQIFENLKSSLGEIKIQKDPVTERLEEKWRQNPENVNVLIQLGKIYKSKKDYLNLLKIYNRLDRLNIKDPYLRGQVQSLIIPQEPKREPLKEIKGEPYNPLKAIPIWIYLIIGIIFAIFFINKVITKGQKSAEETSTAITQEMDKIFSTFDKNIAELGFDIKPLLKLEKEGKLKEAYNGYIALIEEKPNHSDVYVLHGKAGEIGLKLGYYASSVEHLETAYKRAPLLEKKNYIYSLGEAYFKNGENSKAEDILKEGIDLEDEEISPKCLLKRAEIYIKQGKLNLAKVDLDNLINNYPEASEIDDAKNLKNSYGF